MRVSQVVNGLFLAITLLIYGMVFIVRADMLSASDTFCEPPKTVSTSPRLVMETGGHQAHIRELLFTADGRELISVSDDKTIRVWGLSQEGQQTGLVRTIRGYMAEGRVGALYAAALSPPNATGHHQWLAVGGFLPDQNQDLYAIRLHDYASGEVVALLYGHRNVINALAFSPDGRWLASAGKDNTVQLWDLKALQGRHMTKAALVFKEHTEPIYDLAWSADGFRLASASYDHTVGLWDTSRLSEEHVSLIARLQGHHQPVLSVAFHPTEAVLVSGGKDQTIRQWRADDGHALGILAKTGNWVAALAFSPDGNALLAGRMGGPDKPKRITIYRYPDGKAQLSFTGHDNVVLATAFHPQKPWIASGGGNQKEILLWHRASGDMVARLQGKGQTIWSVGFAKHGRSISWGQTFNYQQDNRLGPLEQRFDLTMLKRRDGGLRSSESVRALEHVGELSLSIERGGRHDYPYRLHIRRGRRVISTIDRDASNGYRHSAYSFTPDGRYILSGGLNGTLTLYTLDGTTRAHLIGHTGEIKALAISADGQLAVSGASDQTLKLWSLANLPDTGVTTIAPKLTLFPTSEVIPTDEAAQQEKEWVAWTPNGFFAASHHGAGAKLIGYSLNQGLDRAAKYISVDQLYDVFYRPDVVQSSLSREWPKEGTLSPDITTVLAEGLPPCIQFLTPKTDTTVTASTLIVRVGLIDQGGGIGKVVWRVNGATLTRRPWENSQVISEEAGFSVVLAKKLPLMSGENTIEVIAYNRRNEIASPASVLTLQVHTPTLQPTLHLLAIGINDYQQAGLQLKYAQPDAQAISEAFRRIGAPLFKTIRVIELYNDQVTWANIEGMFQTVAQDIAPHDVFVLYLAGHGVTLDGHYYFLLHDIQDYRPATIRNSISCRNRSDTHRVLCQDALQHWLALISASKSLVLLDTCESGSFEYLSLPEVSNLIKQTAVDKLTRATGRAIIAAASAWRPALEGYQNHGLFTYTLLEAMGQADRQSGDRDGKVSVLELAMYVDKWVPELSRQVFKKEQITHYDTQGRNFLIGVADSPPLRASRGYSPVDTK